MSVICPYCKHKMRVKGAHAGRFTPRCDRCDKKFFLVIPSEPGTPPMATPLRDPSLTRRAP
jgi:DNA-directed RNA polymerase subunit RPC12/RpoP